MTPQTRETLQALAMAQTRATHYAELAVSAPDATSRAAASALAGNCLRDIQDLQRLIALSKRPRDA